VQSAGRVSIDTVVEILWETAASTLLKAFFATIFGSIAFGIVGELCKDMAPSMPPGFSHQQKAEAEQSQKPHVWPDLIQKHQFAIVYGAIFIPTVGFRLRNLMYGAPAIAPRSRLSRIGRRLSENWFGLMVGNAFGAMIAAVVLVWVSQFSWLQFLLHMLLGAFLPSLKDIVGWLFGHRMGNALGAWLDWYGDNQLKFTFWVLYIGAICDDIGIPNFKSLGRWAWRKYRTRGKSISPETVPP
jgi:hypothetical protein